MPALANVVAALVYCLPIAVWLAIRSRPDAPAWELAIGIPSVVCVDLLVILGLSRLLTLEQAALLSRAFWLVAGAVVAVRRRGAWADRWPRAIGRRELW